MQIGLRRGPLHKPSPRAARSRDTFSLPEQEFNTQITGRHSKFSRRMKANNSRIKVREMSILTTEEKSFLDVFLHEVTTPPFQGPATAALHSIEVEYGDISYLAWAYDQDVPRTDWEWGHAAEVAPPLPWPNRESALRRNAEVQSHWKQERTPADAP
jgi:hypothetical protein